MHDLQLCSDCLNEIAEDKPSVIIVDNDDFQNGTLKGSYIVHHAKVMYVCATSLSWKLWSSL